MPRDIVCAYILLQTWTHKYTDYLCYRYSSKAPAVDLQYVMNTKDSDNVSVPEESDDFLKLLELEKESYVNQFASVLIPNANILKAEGIGEGK